MAEPVKYSKPPILEALCEVHFDRPAAGDAEHEKMRSLWVRDYPDQRIIDEQNLEFQVRPEGVSVQQQPRGRRLIARSADGLNLVQLTANFLVVNRLAPYPGWKEFFAATILSRGRDVCAMADLRIRRVGLRYINRITIPQQPFVWEDWFQMRLPIPSDLPSEHQGFHLEFQRRIGPNERMDTKIIAVNPAPPGTTSVILDLDVIWEGEPLGSDRLAEMLDRVHHPHRLAFESYLTEKVRKLFH